MLKSIRRLAKAESVSIGIWAFVLCIEFLGNSLPVLNELFNPHAESGVWGIYIVIGVQAISLVILLWNIPIAILDLLKYFQERTPVNYLILVFGIVLAGYISYILFSLVLQPIH